jgi:hypothetical protein
VRLAVLTGKYDFTVRSSGIGTPPGIGATPSPESSQASIISAVEEHLGLKLILQNAPLEIVVIDHAMKPKQTSAAVPGKGVSPEGDPVVGKSMKLTYFPHLRGRSLDRIFN